MIKYVLNPYANVYYFYTYIKNKATSRIMMPYDTIKNKAIEDIIAQIKAYLPEYDLELEMCSILIGIKYKMENT